jgi:lipopolysaccharide/colanic/teichoic acid biosynthesis glycosyltransferase
MHYHRSVVSSRSQRLSPILYRLTKSPTPKPRMESSNATHPRPRIRATAREIEKASPGHPATPIGKHGKSHYGAAIKRIVDLLAGLVLILLLLPILLLIALAVKLDSRGPVLFKQRRLGLDMEPFVVLKFRTMMADSSPELHQRYIEKLVNSQANDNGAVVNGNGAGQHNGNGDLKKLTTDPRVTRVGRFLRRTSLDELPQLFNVVGGSMSLIGPRPALEYELEHYRQSHYRRFEVRPGITGLWQVSGRNRLGFHEMLDLDVEYSEDPTLATDIRILVRTPIAALRHAA